MMWRFFPLADPFIDVFVSRDTDSYILQREVDAVKIWLASDKLVHIMRDHPDHLALILGGMWGFKTFQNRSIANLIFEKMFNVDIVNAINPLNLKPRGTLIYKYSYIK